MTVDALPNYIEFAGDGTTGPFTFTFTFDDNSEIVVTTTDALGVVTVIGSANYTLTGAGTDTGGTVTMSSSVAVGLTLTITRILPLSQTLSLVNGGPFSATSIMQALDRVVKMVQQQNNAPQADAQVLSLTGQAVSAAASALSVLSGLAAKANLSGATFTGAVAISTLSVSTSMTVPTVSGTDSSTEAASTAQVQAAIAAANPPYTQMSAASLALVAGTSGTINLQYSAASAGWYTKEPVGGASGHIITFAIMLIIGSILSPVGSLTMTGLPYADEFLTAVAINCEGLASGATGNMQARTSGSSILISSFNAGVAGNAAALVKANSVIYLFGSYYTTS